MLHELTLKKDVRTFSVSPENPTGAKGAGGRATLAEGSAANAARDLGQGWKVNPYVRLEAGKTAVLADICGEGAIKHFWITDSARHGGRYLPLQDDISSVAYWYSDNLEDVYPALPAPDELELI